MLETKFPDADIRLSDTSFKLVDAKQFKAFLSRNATDGRKYIRESHDCDDFSYILLGDVTKWDSDLAFGIAWGTNSSGTNHSVNLAITTSGDIVLVEPQNDEIIHNLSAWDIRFVLM
ncbi:lectin MOA-related protein [Methanolobus psychrotolerans]|uniref:lectin MOA-related protein n=1 Tax=Methanolobus psychrotolerans TaxID=1874706 RepID=UPI00101ADCD9|nr:lectin MOA-related protein [Methanolobus psychrotolerans]